MGRETTLKKTDTSSQRRFVGSQRRSRRRVNPLKCGVQEKPPEIFSTSRTRQRVLYSRWSATTKLSQLISVLVKSGRLKMLRKRSLDSPISKERYFGMHRSRTVNLVGFSILLKRESLASKQVRY